MGEIVITEAMRETNRRERAAQGLPPVVEDPVVLDRLAVLFGSAAASASSAKGLGEDPGAGDAHGAAGPVAPSAKASAGPAAPTPQNANEAAL